MPGASQQHRWASWLLERNRRGMRFVLLIALALYPTFGILDYFLAPRYALPLLFTTRALVALTSALLLLKVVKGRLFDVHPNVISSGYILLAAFGISLM